MCVVVITAICKVLWKDPHAFSSVRLLTLFLKHSWFYRTKPFILNYKLYITLTHLKFLDNCNLVIESFNNIIHLLKHILFIYFGLCWDSLLHRFFSRWALSEWGLLSNCTGWASHFSGFSRCREWALGWQFQPSSQTLEHRSQLCHMGLVVLWHVGSSQIKDWTHVSCTGRQILYHWAIWEAQSILSFSKKGLRLPNVSGPMTVTRGTVNTYQFQEVHHVVG